MRLSVLSAIIAGITEASMTRRIFRLYPQLVADDGPVVAGGVEDGGAGIAYSIRLPM